MKLRLLFLLLAALLPGGFACADAPPVTGTVDLSGPGPQVLSGHLTLGSDRAPDGETLDANSLYLLRDGKPWLPVMGEFHFSRFPRAQWEDAILQMKANGVNIISAYIIWIHHEEVKGQWDWTGNRDLRYFATLCKKHGVYFFPRIGPWAHGEVRNGGFPDWVLAKSHVRSTDPAFLGDVQELYTQIGRQLQGLYFKDRGPVIGVQIENEYRFNSPSGLAYMLTLKRMARDAGMDVPFYTATGWQGADLHQTELIPVWGAYPEAPWDGRTGDLGPNGNYLFTAVRRDPAIGSDLRPATAGQTRVDFTGSLYPFATAEMGGGNQVTYHRRPIITAPDVVAQAYAKLGSGANLLGYYMFHGGSNPLGRLSTMQESRATHYPNDMPLISYDFYAPIGEWGQLRPSYREFKTLHLFLNDFGGLLAPDYPVFPDKRPTGPNDTQTLRWAVRAHDDSGFLFLNNYQREVTMQDIPAVQLSLKLKSGATLTIPEHPVTIRKDAAMIWPFNLVLGGARLRYATAQPLCRLDAGGTPLYVFFAPEGIAPEYVYETAGLASLHASGATVTRGAGAYHVSGFTPGTGCLQTLRLTGGKTVRLLTLTRAQALDCWKGHAWGADRLFLSPQDLTFPEGAVQMRSAGSPAMSLAVYPAPGKPDFGPVRPVSQSRDGLFTRYRFSLPAHPLQVSLREESADDKTGPVPTTPQPGPQYGAKWQPVPGARTWRIGISPHTLRGLSDAFLMISYAGDTAAAYLNGTLVADDFYAGLPMTVGLRRFAPAIGGGSLRLQVVPLTDARNIYFEPGVREPLRGRDVAEVRRVTVIPEYQAMVRAPDAR